MQEDRIESSQLLAQPAITGNGALPIKAIGRRNTWIRSYSNWHCLGCGQQSRGTSE